MKKAVLRSAGTAALGVVFAAAAAGTASAAPALPDPLGGIGLAGASQNLPLAGPLTQTVGALNPATGARVVAQGVHTVEPTLSGVADAADHLASNSGQRQMPVATTRAMGPGGVNLTPTSHGNSFGGPLGQVLGLLGTGSLLG
ncbi:hypothetical protein [Peterkaempfera griseoplana]|uniref:hypothetical protein n=1 Tax=Peterkaempfera griseoplana TaxID=66896 RepID=UPI0006E3B288|nr:hypothetical protein [Peterkaempfera griseoplana]